MGRRTLRRTPLAAVAALALLVGPAPGAAPAQEPDVEVDRVSGTDRTATAAALAREAFPDGADLAYIATGEDFPDALAAGPLAAVDDAPLLLVWRTESPDSTDEALRDLGVSRAIVLGGFAAVDPQAEGQVRSIVGETERLAGDDRFETAAMIAGRFEAGVPVAYVANGSDFPDALAGGAAGAAAGGPVLLTQHGRLPPATAEALQGLAPESIAVLGGTAAVSDAVLADLERFTDGPVRRLSGRDRFATSAAISASTYPAGAATAFLATGTAFPDGLAAGPVAGLAGAPLLLSTRDCVPRVVLDEIERLGAERVVLVGGGAALGRGPARLEPCGIEITEVATGLRAPWDVAFAPGGRVFVTERDTGRVVELTGAPRVVRTFPVDSTNESGLLGLAASPDFAEDNLLYAYMTTGTDNRVVRFPADDQGTAPTPVLTGIPRTDRGIHHGGRIAFGPGGLLYVTTGDAAVPERSQQVGSLAGKILRVRPDGTVPPDNPFRDSPVWALGLRNSQGLAFYQPHDWRLYATDFGPGCDDEINHIQRGANYGWPDGCGETRPGAFGPLVVRQPPVASWSGLAVLTDGLISPWEGDLFAAALRGERLWRFELRGGRVVGAQSLLEGQYGRLRHVAQAPDGSLWVLTNNRDGRGTPRAGDDRILRIAPPGW